MGRWHSKGKGTPQNLSFYSKSTVPLVALVDFRFLLEMSKKIPEKQLCSSVGEFLGGKTHSTIRIIFLYQAVPT